VIVLVDTTIWSLALRRRDRDLAPAERAAVAEWGELVRSGEAALAGPVRQELLSGVRDEAAFRLLAGRLSAFVHLDPCLADYDQAAVFFNRCRGAGVVGRAIDMLLCAVAHRHAVPIFTTDRDFERYARHLPIRLHAPR
jgi:predicted nucleic acid-binding protein